jgi:hypothetical protein
MRWSGVKSNDLSARTRGMTISPVKSENPLGSTGI